MQKPNQTAARLPTPRQLRFALAALVAAVAVGLASPSRAAIQVGTGDLTAGAQAAG
jgi:hypothetical protein